MKTKVLFLIFTHLLSNINTVFAQFDSFKPFSTSSSLLIVGFFYGVMFIVGLLGFLFEYIFKVRLYLWFATAVFYEIFAFLLIDGFIENPIKLMDFTIIRYGLFFFITIYIKRISLVFIGKFPLIQSTHKLTFIAFTILFGILFVSPIWASSSNQLFMNILSSCFKFVSFSLGFNNLLIICLIYKKGFFLRMLLTLGVVVMLMYICVLFSFSLKINDFYRKCDVIIAISCLLMMLFALKKYINSMHNQLNKIADVIPYQSEKQISQIKERILTHREEEILNAYANGFTYQEISDAMLISSHTVRSHLKSIYRKLEINSKAEAIRYVLENGLER